MQGPRLTNVFTPGKTVIHRLDPRTKVLCQLGFAAAAFRYATPRGLVLLALFTLAVLVAAHIDPLRVLWSYRFVFPFLLIAPVISSLSFGQPWIRPADALPAVHASVRVLLVLLVGAVYVKTTSVRESQAAIAFLVPGRLGRILGLAVGLVFRFLPVLREDLFTMRDAMAARLGDERPVPERMQRLTVMGLTRVFTRADRLTLALQARCLSWNPTAPPLAFTRLDVIPLLIGASLLLASILPWII